jgi:hypothetical protein
MSRVCCYFDGLNLYHAIDELNRPHFKWVDLAALARTMLRPGEQIASAKYFSAFATWLPGPDVRIALAILEDGYDESYDRAIIVSADSDLVSVIERARKRFVDKTYCVATCIESVGRL